MFISTTIRFWLFLMFLISSIFCSIFVLYHYCKKRRHLHAIHNHAIILIVFLDLVYELTVILWMTYFYRTGQPLFSTPSFCLTWSLLDYSVFSIASNLIVWMTFERHILIFHKTYHSTQKKRLLFHYIPIILLFLYPCLFYIYVFVIQSCETTPNYAKSRCGYSACVSQDSIVAMWDSIVNNIIPTFLLAIFGIALFTRIFYTRQRAHRQIRWRDYRKLVIELLPISTINILFYFPPTLLNTAYISGVPTSVGSEFYSFCMYFSYCGIFLTPIASAITLFEFKKIVLFWNRLRPRIRAQVTRINRLTRVRARTVVPIY